jgi:lipopolysaccharide export system protein LptA
MLKTKTDTITARDKITYDTKKNELVAHGNAKAVRGQDTITADRLIARFENDPATGETKMREMEGVGHVVITTATDTMRGEHGTYNARTNKARMTGGVRIDRGLSNISGASGEVDLNTNTSKIFSDDGAKPDERVRGVFYPE